MLGNTYAGDVSEETRATVQKLKVSLEEAEKELAETQYDKYISDTKELLSEMQEDMNTAIQDIVNSLSKNFNRLIDEMDADTKNACGIITEKMDGIGYLSTDEFHTLLSGSSIDSSVSSMLTEVKDYHTKMKEYAEELVKYAKDSTAGDSTGQGEVKVFHGEVRRYGGNSATGVQGYKTGSKSIPKDQIALLGEEGMELQFDKSEGVLQPVGEGDMVFTDEMSKRLWEISQMPIEFLREKFSVPDIPTQIITPMDTQPRIIENNQLNGGDVNISFGDITLPNVTNGPEFTKSVESVIRNAMCENGRTKKCVVESVAGSLVGKSFGMEGLWR